MESQISANSHNADKVASFPWRWSMGLAVLALLLFLVVGLVLVTMPATAGSSIEVYGPIEVPTTWPAGTYYVTGTVIIQNGGVLTIEAGAEVYFDSNTQLRVNTGPLFVLGDATDSVLFTANTGSPDRGFWDGIFFDDTALPSTIDHATVEYASTGVSIGGDTDFHTISNSTFRHNGDGGDWTSGGAIHTAGDVLTVSDNLIYNNELGVRLQKSFGGTISGNEIHNNDGFGIGFIAQNSPGGGGNTITDNHIYGNGGFGLGFVAQLPLFPGGDNNTMANNHIHDNVAANGYLGNGVYLDWGTNNNLADNLIHDNSGHGVWARSQTVLGFTDNIVYDNDLNGFTYDDPNSAVSALHSNVLCRNTDYQLQSLWPNALVAEGNWFGTQTPILNVDISGIVDFDPWISMAVAVEPPSLPADGTSTATISVTMSGGGFSVPDGYTVTVSASQGDVSPPVVTLVDGQGTATYTAGTVPGSVDIQVSDHCTSVLFTDVLTNVSFLDLAVTKSDGGLIVGPTKDYSIEYTIVVTNAGSVTATDVVLTDILPIEGTYTGSDWACSGGECRRGLGTLVPSDTVTVNLPVLLDKTALDCPIVLTNTVQVADTLLGDANPANNVFTLTSTFDCLPDLVVVINDNVGGTTSADDDWVFELLGLTPEDVEQPACVYPGEQISYTIAYVNAGLITATQVVLTETVPEFTSYVGYGWSCAGGVCTLGVGVVPPDTGGVAYFTVHVDAAPPDLLVEDEVRIGGAEEDLYPPDNVSYEETPICEHVAQLVYLPIIMREYEFPVEPTPSPPPGPDPTPSPPPPPTPEPPYVSDVAVNPETNRVYVASPLLDAVLAVDPTGDGSVIANIPVGDHPVGLAVVTTTNKIYAANFNSWTLTPIRGSDHTPIEPSIYVGAQACKVAADSADGRVYVTNHLESDNGAAAVNSQTDEFIYYYSRLHATAGRYGIDVDPVQEKLFIAGRGNGLIAIQDAYYPDQDPLIVKLVPETAPYVVAFNPTTDHLFVTAPEDNLVVVLDPYSIQLDRGIWITWEGQRVFLLDRTNAGWIKEIGVGLGAEEGIAVDPATGYVFVTNADSDTVSIIQDDPDPANIDWIRDVTVGEYPQGVGVNTKTHLVYVGNAESRDLTVIDGTTFSVTKTIPLE